jgi:drug/metabolite transporter (DMT)-like permease
MTDKVKAAVYMSLSALSFAVMAAMVRLAGDIPIIEKVFFRNLVSLLIAFFMLRKTKYSFFGKKGNTIWLVLRSAFGLLGVILYFYSVDNITLADSSMLNRLSPFFVTVFAAFFLKERITKIEIPALIIVFTASLLIVKPTFNVQVLPYMAGIIAAAGGGAAYTIIRFLRNRENPLTIVFFFSFFSVVSLLPFLFIDFKIPNLEQAMYLILIGVFAAGGQFGLTYGYKYGRASEASLYSYLNVVFAAFIGFILWTEVPDLLSIISSIVIILVSVFLVFYKGKAAPPKKLDIAE